MSSLLSLLLIAAWSSAYQAAAPPPKPACSGWQDCRDEALAAAERGEYELFHDLAWRAVQQGPKNDAALMTMLARAQSLSGRPHDALVMLQRLAALGVVTDAEGSDEFRRVRALAGWADLEARVVELKDPRPAPAPGREDPPAATPARAGAARPGTTSPPADPPTPPDTSGTGAAVKKEEAEAVGAASDALRFAADPFTPVGLAYDAVSERFIVGDGRERKLSVIGARSGRMATFVGAESAGFGEIGGMAIDPRQGDLWVASTNQDNEIGARLHKLQLISGRLLFTAALPATSPPARLGDIAITPQGAVLALDTIGRRVYRLPLGPLPQTGGLEPAAAFDLLAPISIAPASESIVYVAHAAGISRLDLQARSVAPVKASGGLDLTGFEWIRWHRSRLIGIQRASAGTYRIARIRLDGSGAAATRVQVLDRDVPMRAPPAAVISGDVLYYLTAPGPSDRAEGVVRRITVK